MKLSGFAILATLLIASTASAATPWINSVRWLKSCSVFEIKGQCKTGDDMGVINDSCDHKAGGYSHLLHTFWCEGPHFKVTLPTPPHAGDTIFLRSHEQGCDPSGGVVVPACRR